MPNWMGSDVKHYLATAMNPTTELIPGGKITADYYARRGAGEGKTSAWHGTFGDVGATAAILGMFFGGAAAMGGAGSGSGAAGGVTGGFGAGAAPASFGGGAASFGAGSAGGLSLGSGFAGSTAGLGGGAASANYLQQAQRIYNWYNRGRQLYNVYNQFAGGPQQGGRPGAAPAGNLLSAPPSGSYPIYGRG